MIWHFTQTISIISYFGNHCMLLNLIVAEEEIASPKPVLENPDHQLNLLMVDSIIGK